MPEIIATLDSPAAIGALPGTSFAKGSLAYVPGSVLRGAVAAAWIDAGRPIDAQFRRAFEGDVAWGPLHLAGSLPTPISQWWHKYAPGPRCQPAWDDSLKPIPDSQECPDCGEPLVRAKGDLKGVRLSEQSHVQLVDGVAAKGQLFMRRQIVAGQAFRGFVSSADEALIMEALATAGIRPGSPGTLWLGGRRGSDRGRATVAIGSSPKPALAAKDRVVRFMLASPGVFVDDAGRASARPHPAELADVLGAPVAGVDAWTRWTTVGGWHAASRLPKSNERAAAIGSVYRVRLSSAPTPEALARLASRGIGLRRAEGFGAVLPVPALPRSRAELTREVVALRGLAAYRGGVFLSKLLAELAARAEMLRTGQPPAPAPVLQSLTNPPPPMVAAFGVPRDPLVAAARYAAGLTDPAEIDMVSDILGGTR